MNYPPIPLAATESSGTCALISDRFEEAEKTFGQAATLAPDDVNVLLGLAQSKMFLGKWIEGEEVINRALAIEPRPHVPAFHQGAGGS